MQRFEYYFQYLLNLSKFKKVMLSEGHATQGIMGDFAKFLCDSDPNWR